MATIDDARRWIGREERVSDVLALAPARGMAALLDRDARWVEMGAPLPPLWHWLYLQRPAPQSQLGPDGHERLGHFLPPLQASRRMWAGGRVHFLAPLRLGIAATRTATVAAVEEKHGRSGSFVLVTVRHCIEVDGQAAVEETQQLAYRPVIPEATSHGGMPVSTPPRVSDPKPRISASGRGAATHSGDAEPPQWSSTFTPTATLLFRFSALTFNGHRIHYDQPYATGVEGYPALVVHAPLLAILLLDDAIHNAGAGPIAFEYRAHSPLFAGDAVHLEGAGDALRALGPDGRVAMTATVSWG